MDRRTALSLLGLGLVSACGGGGGGGAAPSATGSVVSGGGTASPSDGSGPAPTPTPVHLNALSPHVACWGDSITDLYWSSLQQVYPARQVYNGGVVGQTSMQIAARQTGDAAHKTWISVLWYGHNNYGKDQVKADIAASIAALAPGNEAFVILSMLNWAGSGNRGTQEYADTIRVNAELAAMYPDHYIDMRAHLVSLYDPGNAQDVQDHQNDLPPSSLRFDGIHLNDAGCNAVASKLKEFIDARGW
jgi:lysophospholipase L1-like esterase